MAYDISEFDPRNAIADIEQRKAQLGPSLEQQAHRTALKKILKASLLGLGIGGGLAAGAHAYQGFRDWMSKKDDRKDRPGGTKYLSFGKAAGIGEEVTGGLSSLATMLKRYGREAASEGGKVWRKLTDVKDEWDVPYYAAGMVGGALGGGYLGYRQLDKMLDAWRKKRLEGSVEEARKKFELALQKERAKREEKKASVETPAELLDLLSDMYLNKEGMYKDAGALSKMQNFYLLLAAMLGAGGYYFGRQFADKYNPRYKKLKALELAQKRRFKQSPVRLSFKPTHEQKKKEKSTKRLGMETKEPLPAMFEEDEESATPLKQKSAALSRLLLNG